MKILHTATLYNWGGEQRKILLEMQLLRELGNEVILFCNPNSKLSIKAKELGFEVIIQKMSKKNYFITVPKLIKTIKQKDINLVITHGSTDSWIGAISRIFSNKKVKFYRERHNLFKIKGFVSRFMHKYMFDKILYISKPVKNYLLQIGINKDKLIYLPTTVDTEKLSSINSTFKDDLNIKTKHVVGTFTSLTKDKGVFELIEALKIISKQINDITFVLAGDCGEDSKNFIEKELNGTNYLITGFREDAINIMKSLNIFIFASHSEGLGTVLIETMCAKTPIVCFNKSPMSELVLNNVRGLNANYLDSADLALKTLELLQNDELKKRFTQNAFEFVQTNYDTKILKDALKQMLKDLN